MCPIYLYMFLLLWTATYLKKKKIFQVIEAIWPFIYSLHSLNSKLMSLVELSVLIIKRDCVILKRTELFFIYYFA